MKNKREFWSSHIEGWKSSGVSQKRYCRQHGLAVSTFQWWHSRLKAALVDPTSLALVPVSQQVVRSSLNRGQGAAVRIRIGQFAIEIEQGFDRSVLAEVIEVFASR